MSITVTSTSCLLYLSMLICSRTQGVHTGGAHWGCTQGVYTGGAHRRAHRGCTQGCTQGVHTGGAHRRCTHGVHTGGAHRGCTQGVHTGGENRGCTQRVRTGVNTGGAPLLYTDKHAIKVNNGLLISAYNTSTVTVLQVVIVTLSDPDFTIISSDPVLH